MSITRSILLSEYSLERKRGKTFYSFLLALVRCTPMLLSIKSRCRLCCGCWTERASGLSESEKKNYSFVGTLCARLVPIAGHFQSPERVMIDYQNALDVGINSLFVFSPIAHTHKNSSYSSYEFINTLIYTYWYIFILRRMGLRERYDVCLCIFIVYVLSASAQPLCLFILLCFVYTNVGRFAMCI